MVKSIFEQMGGTYTKVGDYYIPDLIISKDEQADERPIGKYGRLRRTYLEEYHSPIFNHLLLSGKLHSHLRDVEQQAQQMLDTMIPQMAKAEEVTEELKATDQMLWVGKMNNIKARVEEVIYAEIVYQ